MTDKPRCGAKGRNGTCKNPPITGRKRCRMHGGTTPRGPASANYIHGRRSKALPQHIRGSYEEAINDPDLLRLKSEIALSETRRQDLMSQLDKGSHDDFLKELNLIRIDLKVAALASDTGRIRKLSQDLDILMNEKRPDGSVWRGLIEIEDHKRKLVESERKRMVELGQLLTMEQSLFLLKRIAEIIKANVSDQTIMRIIINDVLKLQGSFE